MTDKISIPEHHQVICRAVARVCREHGLSNATFTYRPDWEDPWSTEIVMHWEQGRHGADSGTLRINSNLQVRTQIDIAAERDKTRAP